MRRLCSCYPWLDLGSLKKIIPRHGESEEKVEEHIGTVRDSENVLVGGNDGYRRNLEKRSLT